MTSTLKFGGVRKYPDFVDKYYINFADREGGGGKKIPSFRGRQIWKLPRGPEIRGRAVTAQHDDDPVTTSLPSLLVDPDGKEARRGFP